MTSHPPVCPLCKKRCGRFLCPCCGMHAVMPWKCDVCQPHEQPCMVVLNIMREEEKPLGRTGCLIALLFLAIAIGAVVLAIRAITGR